VHPGKVIEIVFSPPQTVKLLTSSTD